MIRAVIFDVFETLITHYRAPLYFGTQMAADAGLDPAQWLPGWRATEQDRSTGRLTLEDVLGSLLRAHGRYSPALAAQMARKRTAAVEACFDHLHPEILPLLDGLRARGLKTGILSNCFSEEAAVLRRSVLADRVDWMGLSYEQGMMKPDPAFYRRCADALGVDPAECLFVGDGGSHELEGARALGMRAVQAVWYLRPGVTPSQPRDDFPQAKSPLAVLDHINKGESPMYIRRAAPADLPGINRLLNQVLMVHHHGRPDLFKAHVKKYTDPELLDILADDTRPVFAAVNERNDVLGYAFCVLICHENDNILTDIRTLYIDDLCVDESLRGHHIGRALYDYVVQFARAAGCYNLTLNVWSCNPGAMKFYEKCGLLPQKIGMELIL